MRSAFQQFRDKPGMQRMTGAIRHQAAQHRLSNQRKITQKVERLVPHKLVRKTQRRIVQHARFGQHDRIVQRPAPDQAARLQPFHFMIKAEGSGRRNGVRIIRALKFNFKALLADQRMRKIDLILNGKYVRRIDAEGLLAFLSRQILW